MKEQDKIKLQIWLNQFENHKVYILNFVNKTNEKAITRRY